jgi:predicted XRE-type DNA-binding protein
MKRTKPFKILTDKMPIESQKKALALTKHLITEMRLKELRNSQQICQEQIAELLDTKQSNISRMENRMDMYISTLRDYIEALGGELDIIARFPDREIKINQFSEIYDNA